MSKNKITILILTVIAITIFGWGIKAAEPSLYVSPAATSKTMNSVFDIVVKINPAGQKVCAVEGQLLLSKLSLQKINLGENITPQTSPSFNNNLSFLLGIPGCATQEKTLFTVRVKALSVGEATTNFRKVDIIGEGVSISSASVGGNYEIVMPSTVTGTESPSNNVISCSCDNWNSWQNESCGEGECSDTQMAQIRTRSCNPTSCDIEEQTQCINDSQCILAAKTPAETAPAATNSGLFLAAIGNIFSLGTGNILVEILVGIIILGILVYLLYFLSKRRRKEK